VNANIAARLVERAATQGGRPAIVQIRGGKRSIVGFADLGDQVARLAAGLRSRGIQEGDRVLIFVPMSIDLYVALLATLHAGAVAVFLDAWSDRKRLDAAVAAARPDLFVGTWRAQMLRAVSPAIRAIPRHWASGGWPFRLHRFAAGSASSPALADERTPALITFTTGSTGAPKAAVRTHGLLWAQHLALARHLNLPPDAVDMPTLPIFVLNNLALGITSVIPDFDPRRPGQIDPVRIAKQMQRERVTTASGSPSFFVRLAEWRESGGRQLEFRLWTGGAPVYPAQAVRLQALAAGGANVVYGSTEAEPIAGIPVPEMLREMDRQGGPGGICCGRPIPGLGLKIIRPTDLPLELSDRGWQDWVVAEGEAGEIVVWGAHVLGEYWNAPEESRRHKIRDGGRVWHRTGDAGWLDEGGRLWLLGRIVDRVEREDKFWWSMPAEIRALAHPEISHAAYFGARDATGSIRAVLCVESRSRQLSASACAALKRSLAPIPIDDLHVMRTIPRDPRHASKTNMEALRRLIA
jgi:olefin beta-lactone synthetase